MPKGEALEERISAQALTADLKTAIVACSDRTGIPPVDGR